MPTPAGPTRTTAWPEPRLIPADPIARADAMARALLIAADIHPVNNLRVLKRLESQFGADEAAKATIIAKGYGEAPSSPATASAMGAISTAVAVLEMNRPSRAVMTKTPASTARGLASPSTSSSAAAARSVPPAFCSASENGIMPTISTRLCQWIER